MTNYQQWYDTATQEGDLTGSLHAKKQLINSLLNEIEHEQKAQGRKNDPSGTPSTPYVHGAGGLLAAAGAYPVIFSAMVQPFTGMATRIPRLDNQIPFPDEFGGVDTPYLVTLTGQTEGDLDDSANQPLNVCDDAPTAGLLKRCIRTARYGWFTGRTRELAIRDVGRYINSSETPDFTIANSFQTESPFTNSQLDMRGGNWINSEMQTRMIEVGNSVQRFMMPKFYSGDPNNSSAGSGYREFEGVDLLYTNTARDISGVRCAAADSLVIAWNANVNSTNLQGLGFYEMLEQIEYYLSSTGEQVGLIPELEISMDYDLFWLLTRTISVTQYNRLIASVVSANGSNFGGNLVIDAQGAQSFRDEMWNGKYLPLNGKRISVVLENASTVGTTRTVATNTSSSTVYFHCKSVNRIPVLYWQFRNMGNRFAMEAINQSNGQIKYTDNGKFVWTFNQRNGCIDWSFQTEPRLMAHTPFLSARLTGVQYQPALHVRDFSPSNSSFWTDGGLTDTPVPTNVEDWTSGASVYVQYPNY